jgi:hypothetical protein
MAPTKKTQKGGVKRDNRLKNRKTKQKQKQKKVLLERKTVVKPQPANNSAFNDLVANMTKAKVANKGGSQEYYPYAPPGYVSGIGTPPENKRYGKKLMHAAENAEEQPFDPENYGPPKGQYAVGK